MSVVQSHQNPAFVRALQKFRIHLALFAFLSLLAIDWGVVHSCPDWPTCFGRAWPAFDGPIFLSWAPRAFGVMALLGFLGLGWSCWRVRKSSPATLRRWGFAGTWLVATGWTQWLMSAAAGSATAIVAHLVAFATLWISVASLENVSAPTGFSLTETFKRVLGRVRMVPCFLLPFWSLGLLILRVVNSQNGGALALCGGTFPSCRGTWLASGSTATSFVMLERLFVVGFVGIVFALVAGQWHRLWQSPDARDQILVHLKRCGIFASLVGGLLALEVWTWGGANLPLIGILLDGNLTAGWLQPERFSLLSPVILCFYFVTFAACTRIMVVVWGESILTTEAVAPAESLGGQDVAAGSRPANSLIEVREES